jgi:linoleoyl-CoA desaturase
MTIKRIKFINKEKSDFFATLRQNVDAYFEENKICKTGGKTIIFKAVFMLLLYFVPYFLILSGQFNEWQMLLLAFIAGLGVAGVGMSVMHDANHGAFSDKKWLNDWFGASLYFLGGNVQNWKVQHNQLHHTYTNIHEIDEDITGKVFLRLSYNDKLKPIHQFQYIYAFALYSLMTISFLWKDFKEIKLYKELAKGGFVKAFTEGELFRLYISKIVYLCFIFVIPMLFTKLTLLQWFVGFMLMHCTAGLILTVVFQLAHVVEGANQPLTNEQGNIESAWAVHQIQTTANFSSQNYLLSWYIGGLDYQIEHHLFPNISHVHYRAIAPIVRTTAEQYGIQYNDKCSFLKAVGSHIQMLKDMGKKLMPA